MAAYGCAAAGFSRFAFRLSASSTFSRPASVCRRGAGARALICHAEVASHLKRLSANGSNSVRRFGTASIGTSAKTREKVW